MNNLTRKFIEERIDILLKEFAFDNRKKKYSKECPCYDMQPCHNIKNLNCFLCYCPFYKNDSPEGGCSIENPLGKGKWFYRVGHEISNKIWDCSDCTYPHKEENIKAILLDFFGGGLYHYLKEVAEKIG